METDVVITLKVPSPLKDEINRRARGLDLNRSQYFRRLVREDIESAAGKKAEAVGPQKPEGEK